MRGAGQKVDINNFSVYACRLNEDSLSEPSAEGGKRSCTSRASRKSAVCYDESGRQC
ncbi:MAG: hypothetical protein L6V93_21910 [Clostridiales bacterium]|nr:MAG: hypothetical protein L6V93_21910 [Clostridiales bacterium]